MAGSARKTNVKNSSHWLEFFSCKDFEKEMPAYFDFAQYRLQRA
jgi:hypothetical protein